LNYGGFRANPVVYGPNRVLICDNDNVAPDGTNLGILGFRGFMAPEVTAGKSLPNTETDMYSLAVVLYGLFFRGHPLEGKLTLEKMALCVPGIEKVFYGTHPLFCFNPNDDRNRPDPVVHKHVLDGWRGVFPREFYQLFIKAFTIGLSDPGKRILEKEWRDALIRLRASIAYVKHNSAVQEQFVNLNSQTPSPICLRMRFADGQVVALSHAARLYACHTKGDATGFWTVTASIAAYDDNPLHLVMRNDTQDVWRFSLPGQQPEQATPQGTLPLVPGMSINFAGTEAVVIE